MQVIDSPGKDSRASDCLVRIVDFGLDVSLQAHPFVGGETAAASTGKECEHGAAASPALTDAGVGIQQVLLLK
ncbi:hypothetical protein [Streptomyces sp. NRRL F-5053]|uniref:hypothetical protein n=1 Tax=Streptomyces sp. NRRL F-5053 TaxID=1463854 RepID=UPI0004CA431B|nr:hypothetical protein [Streptomyces sp. NRRL F-5053]